LAAVDVIPCAQDHHEGIGNHFHETRLDLEKQRQKARPEQDAEWGDDFGRDSKPGLEIGAVKTAEGSHETGNKMALPYDQSEPLFLWEKSRYSPIDCGKVPMCSGMDLRYPTSLDLVQLAETGYASCA
jgi:hypothetical protein